MQLVLRSKNKVALRTEQPISKYHTQQKTLHMYQLFVKTVPSDISFQRMSFLINFFRNFLNMASDVSGFMPSFKILFQRAGPRYEIENLPNSVLGCRA